MLNFIKLIYTLIDKLIKNLKEKKSKYKDSQMKDSQIIINSPLYIQKLFSFTSIEPSQLTRLANHFRKSNAIKILLEQNMPLESKQKAIEQLDSINKTELIYFQTGLGEVEKSFLVFINRIMFPLFSKCWTPKNLIGLSIGEELELSTHLKNTPGKYQIIHSFIWGLKKVVDLDPGLVFIYTLKSAILNFIGIEKGNFVKRTTFLGLWCNILFKFIYSLTNDQAYFKIMKLNTLVSEFNISVLSEISDNFPGLGCKTIDCAAPNGKRITPYFYFVENFINTYELKLINNHQLPMVVRPKNWNDTLEKGGYLCNNKGFYQGYHLRHDKGFFKFSETSVNVLNYLQSMAFKIDKQFLKLSTKEIFDLLIALLKEKFSDFIIVLNKDNKIEVLSFKDSAFFIMGIEGNILYLNQWEKITKWISALCLANEFCDAEIKIFTSWHFDFRSRAYSTGFPINSQGDKFTRLFFKLNVQDPIDLDSSCNGLSIIGALLGEESLLFATNVIKTSDNYNNFEKKDIYTIVLSHMLTAFKKEPYYFCEDTKIASCNKLIIKDLISLVIETLLQDRAFAKSFIMTFPYNESSWGRVNKMQEALIKQYKIKYKVVKIPLKEIRLLAGMLNSLFLFSLHELYPMISGFQKLLNSKEVLKAIKKNGKINLKNEFLEGSYTLFIESSRRIAKWNPKEKQFRKSTINESTGQLNSSKLRTGLSPNLIHSKDGCILIGVVNDFRTDKKKISTVHDSYTVDKCNSDYLKQTYFNNFVTHLLKSEHDLRHHLTINEVELNAEQLSFLAEIDIKRTVLLKKIENHSFRGSPWILS